MITSIDFDAAPKCAPWLATFPWLKQADASLRVDFKPGINILFGHNGSGKSTVLNLLAKMLCCHQGGRQVVTKHAAQEFGRCDPWGARLTHDGSSVLYANPDRVVGLSGAHFDDDFAFEGNTFQNLLTRGQVSSGQQTMIRLDEMFDALLNGKWPDVQRKLKRAEVNVVWAEWLDMAEAFLTATIPKSCPTVLLDEPDKSLSITNQIRFWSRLPLRQRESGAQIIVATHCPFALHVEGAHYIETTPGYLDLCRQALADFMREDAGKAKSRNSGEHE